MIRQKLAVAWFSLGAFAAAAHAATATPAAKSKEHDADWARWHPTPPAPLDLRHLPARPELPTTPVVVPRTVASTTRSPVEIALRKSLEFYYGIATKANYPDYGECAGWCGSYTVDLKFRSGEDSQQLPPDAVKMQAFGTPQVLEAYLAAYLALGDPAILERAKAGGNLLLAGQSPFGGWFFEMWVGPTHARGSHVWPGKARWPDAGPEHGTDSATIDDGNTFGPAEALYRLWWVTKDQRYYEGWRRAMDYLVLTQQVAGGGFPQAFPSDGYHRDATFNDGAMLNAVEAMLTAYQRTGDKRYFDSAVHCAEWILRVKQPGLGWGAQYDGEGHVAAARKFEPAGLEPPGTSGAMEILTTVYEWTGDPRYLAPLVDAAGWLKRVQVKPGVWARYYHPDTNAPWYRTVDGQDCDLAQAKGGYTWQGAWGVRGIELAAKYQNAPAKTARPLAKPGGDPSYEATLRLPEAVDAAAIAEIISTQTENGCWPGGGRSGRNKRENTAAYFGSFKFVHHVHQLSAAISAERHAVMP
jgi:hypothetical protein